MDVTAPGCGGGQACIDQTVFGPTQADFYWSATTVAGSPNNARNVNFNDGNVNNNNKTNNNYVRAVRGGS